MPIQVVAAKANGSLYDTVPVNARGSGAGGNGGSVAKAGDSYLLDGVNVSRYNTGVFGSTVLDNDTADKAINSEAFAKNTQRPLGKVLTQTVANEPSLTRSIHKIEVYRTRKLTSAIREGKWDQYSGTFDVGYPLNVVDTVETDNAANPTRSNPGSIVYTSSSSPTVDNYKAKNG